VITVFSGPLFGQSSPPPPPPVTVNVTDDGSGFASAMSGALGGVTSAISTLTGGLFGGIFGGPLKVQDDHEIAKTITNILIARAQLENIIRQYKLATEMAKSIPSLPSQYAQTLRANWAQLNPRNACVSCGTWVSAATTPGANPDATYGGVIAQLRDGSALASSMPSDALAERNARLASSIYLPDAALRADLQALGFARGNDPGLQQAADQCRQDITNASYNSQIQVAQASGACAMLQAQQATNTNVLLGRLVEDAALRKTREIDAATAVANSQALHAEMAQSADQRAQGTQEALENLSKNLLK
jgi:hypothetical protein